jgi:hypothetical protein
MKKRDIDLKTSSEASREARFLFSIVAFFLLFRSVRAGKPGFRPGKSGLSGLRNGVSGRFPDSESPLSIPETALPTAKTGLSPSQKATPKTTVAHWRSSGTLLNSLEFFKPTSLIGNIPNFRGIPSHRDNVSLCRQQREQGPAQVVHLCLPKLLL